MKRLDHNVALIDISALERKMMAATVTYQTVDGDLVEINVPNAMKLSFSDSGVIFLQTSDNSIAAVFSTVNIIGAVMDSE